MSRCLGSYSYVTYEKCLNPLYAGVDAAIKACLHLHIYGEKCIFA